MQGSKAFGRRFGKQGALVAMLSLVASCGGNAPGNTAQPAQARQSAAEAPQALSGTLADGTYIITNSCAGKQLGLRNGAPDPWDDAVLRDAGDSGAIAWQISAAADGSYALQAPGTGSVLQSADAQTDSQTNVDLWTSWNGPTQRWRIQDTGGGSYKFSLLAAPGAVLDAKWAGTGGETNVWLYEDNGSCAQRWTLRAQSAATADMQVGATFTVQQSGTGPNVYVATQGRDDTGTGARSNPFASIDRAMRDAKPGSTIWLAGGTYDRADGPFITAQGTAQDWIVIRPTETVPNIPDAVTLKGTGKIDTDDYGPPCLDIGGAYIDIRNITCDGYNGAGAMLWGAHHIQITGSTFRNLGSTGIAVFHDQFGSSDTGTTPYEIRLEGNIIDNSNLRWKGVNFATRNPTPSPWGAAISAFGDNITVRNNRIDHTIGEGIGIIGPGMWVAGNTVTNSCSVNLYLDTTSDALIEKNFVANTEPAFFRDCPITDYSDGKPLTGTGIQIAAELASYIGKPQQHLRRNVIRNNVVLNTRRPLYYGSYNYDLKGGDGMKGMRIVNNTFVSNADGMLFIEDKCVDSSNLSACRADPRTEHEDTVIANNIFYWTGAAATRGTVDIGNKKGILFSNNLWYGTAAGDAAGSNDVSGNPRFVKPNGSAAADFRIDAQSPAINTGSRAYAPPDDFFGTSRTDKSTADIGASRSP